jgi:CspA family cold shock protein
MSTSASSSTEKFTGRVKWFNNKAGYGFVTVTDGSKSGSDVFIHHSAIKVDSEQYKYLVQGEYVEFTLTSVEGGKHEFQAGEVCGIKGGKLMCETRNELKSARTTYKSVKQDDAVEDDEPSSPRPVSRQPSVRLPRAVKPPMSDKRKAPPKSEQTDGEWTKVVRRQSKPVDDKASKPVTRKPRDTKR